MADPDLILRPAITAAVTRGAMRAFMDLGYMPVLEVPLANGRRADICGVNERGEIAIAEVKSCVADFAVDSKWPEYRAFCDLFFFAVPADFPLDLLAAPDEDTEAPGIILADRFGGAVFRPSALVPLPGARRKAMTLFLARQAAARAALMILQGDGL